MHKLTLQTVDVAGKTVLVRVDYNVPLAADGSVRDDTRIRATLPTLHYLIEQGARVVLMSHLGRPNGQRVAAMSLAPVASRLAEVLGAPVAFVSDCVGDTAEVAVRALAPGGVLLLENLRFHPEEELNDPIFAAALARLGQVFVNDAFGTAHRAHASTVGVAMLLPQAAAGCLMERELDFLGRLLVAPKKPFVAIIGGAKISGKIEVLQSLLARVDVLVVGGAMMFTLLRAQGIATGKSLVEPDHIDTARSLLAAAQARGVSVLLPTDTVVSDTVDGKMPSHVVEVTAIAPADIGVDIGPASVAAIAATLATARTVFWNGPMGIFEVETFARGTVAVAEQLADATARGAITVVGGGDSVAALVKSGLRDKVSHVSTGGGASLEFLEGRLLPGVVALSDAPAAV